MADLSFLPSYQDYVNSATNFGNRSKDGVLSEDQWNALPVDQKWNNVGSGVALAPSDPRYAGIQQQTGGNGLLRLGYTAQSNPINFTYYVDPSKVAQGNGVFATNQQNLTPYSQLAKGVPDWFWPVMFATGVLGGAAGTEAGVFTGAAPTVGEEGALGFTGYGSIAGAPGAASAAGGAGVNGGFNANGTYQDIPQMNPVQSGTLNPIGPDATPLAPSGGNGLLGQLGDKGSSLLGQAGTYIQNNPLRALGLAQTAYGLINGGSKPAGASGGSSSKGGSQGASGNFSLPQQQFSVNPYIQAQINRGYGP